MDISPKDIIIPIATAILSVALPLLLGVIQRIDEKYESTRLMKQFINERATKCFGGILVATILLLFYLLIAPPNKNDFGIFTEYVNNSAVIIATVACVLLCVSFFKGTWLIYTSLLKSISKFKFENLPLYKTLFIGYNDTL